MKTSRLLFILSFLLLSSCGPRGFEISNYEAEQEALKSIHDDPYLKIIKEDEIDAKQDVLTYDDEDKEIAEDTEEEIFEEEGVHDNSSTPDVLPRLPVPKAPTGPDIEIPMKDPKEPKAAQQFPELLRVRPTDQAQNAPNAGSLKNATDFLNVSKGTGSEPFFKIFDFSIKNQSFYGTYDLAQVLAYLGKRLSAIDPSLSINLGGISKKNGGQYGKHGSHQNGIDADISYLVRDPKKSFYPIAFGASNVRETFAIDKQWQIISDAFKSGAVAIMFIDKRIKYALCVYAKDLQKSLAEKNIHMSNAEINYILSRIKHEKGHDDHWHMRIRCNKKTQKNCSQPEKYNSQPTDCQSILKNTVTKKKK